MDAEAEENISIHALRVEGDGLLRMMLPAIADFYPRPPCGGRQGTTTLEYDPIEFLSTPSVWRATQNPRQTHPRKGISIHALRVEGDYPVLDAPQPS